jgi:two-component system NtrC family sensor kinase
LEVKEQAKGEERPIAEVTVLRERIAELEAAEAERQRAAVATQQRAQELETLFTIASILSLPGNFGVQCRGVLEEVVRVVQAHRVILRMPDEEQPGLRTVSAAGEGLERVPPIPLLPYGQSIGSLAFEQGESIVANDYSSYPGASPRLVAHGVKSATALPIKSGGRTLAMITLTSREPGHFNSNRMRLLAAIANGLGGLLENAGLREETRQQATKIEIIGEVARIVTSTLTIDQVYEQFAAEVKKLVPFDRVNINVIHPATGRFTIKYLSGQEVPGRHVGAVLPLAGTLTSQAATTGITVIRDDFAIGPPRPGDQEYLQVGLRSSITVPLVSKGRRIGSLALRSKRPGAYGPRQQDILERLGVQIAPAVENSLLYGELQASIQEKAVVDEVGRIITSTLDIDQVYEQFATAMKKLVDFERATVNVIDRGNNTYQVKYLFGPGVSSGSKIGAVRPLEPGSCTHYVAITNRTLNRADIAASPMFPDDADFVKAGLRSLIAVPLVSKEVIIGSLLLRGRGPGAYEPREQRILEGLAAQIAPAVENSLLYEELQASVQERVVVDEVARIITSTLDIDQVYEQFAVQMKKLVDFERGLISVVDRDKKTYLIRNLVGPEHPGRPVGVVRPLVEGSCTHYVVTANHSLVRPDLVTSPMFPDDADFVKAGLCSLIAVPLVSKDITIGCLILRGRRTGTYGPREQRVLEGLAAQIAPAVENSLLYEELQERIKGRAVVNEVARIVTSTLDIDQTYDQFVQEMKKLVDFDRTSINLIDHRAGVFLVRYEAGINYPGRRRGDVVPLQGTVTQRIMDTCQTLVQSYDGEVAFAGQPERFQAGLRSGMTVPLVSKDRVIGTLNVSSRHAAAFGKRQQVILEGLAAQIAPAVENSLLFQDVQRLALALEAIGDAVAFLDPKGHVQFINRAVAEMTGYGAAEVQGKPIILVAPASPGSRARGREMLRQAAQGGWRGEVQAVRKDGEELTLNLSMAPVRDQQGSVIGIIGVAQDITERKRMEARIQETSRLISLGELAAGAAHEINNPLTVVAGFSQLLMAEDLPQKVRDDLEKIHDAAQRAARIVQNLLSFARKGEPEKQYLDVTAVLDRALAMKEHDFRVSNIQVTCHWSRNLPRTMVDEPQLIQAMLNILANAQQAMAEAQEGGQLVLRASHLRDRRATRLNGRIRISITDNGPGILPEHLPRIFDPFFTTKEVGKGTGLGLSIAYGIVQQHDGDLWAENLPGKGATFHLELPVLGPTKEAAPPPTDLTRTPAKTQRILVVDDEPAIRDLLAKALATEGYEVDMAENGEESWRKMQGQTYGCILLDLKMPGMSGQQLYHRIAKFDQGLAQRVIFVTGDTVSPDTRDFISASGNPAVSKPFKLEDVLRQIRNSLEANSVSQ